MPRMWLRRSLLVVVVALWPTWCACEEHKSNNARETAPEESGDEPLEIMRRMDADGNGRITKQEVLEGTEKWAKEIGQEGSDSLKVFRERIEKSFPKGDADGEGLPIKQAAEAMMKHEKGQAAQRVEMMKKMDTDGNGLVTKEELIEGTSAWAKDIGKADSGTLKDFKEAVGRSFPDGEGLDIRAASELLEGFWQDEAMKQEDKETKEGGKPTQAKAKRRRARRSKKTKEEEL